MVVVALLAVGLLMAGVAVFLVVRDVIGGEDGPADLRRPLTFQRVAETSPPPCGSGTVLYSEGATCFRLGTERMTIDRVESIEAMPPAPESGQTSWAVQVAMAPSDGAAFARLTGKAAEQPQGSHGRRIAMIVGGKVISAPSVSDGPVTGGVVMISGPFTRSEAEGLVERMTGR